MYIEADHTTKMMIQAWAKHQKDKPQGTEENLCDVDHLRRRMDEWQKQDSGWRLLIGVRLANRALEAVQGRGQ